MRIENGNDANGLSQDTYNRLVHRGILTKMSQINKRITDTNHFSASIWWTHFVFVSYTNVIYLPV